LNLDDARLIWESAVEVWQATPTEAHLSLAVLAALLVVDARTRKDPGTAGPRDRQVSQDDVHRASNTSLLRRLWWRLLPPHDLMRIDGLVIDRSRKPHCAWLGPTGAGKSASVATVRVDGARPTLAAMPDLSDPIIAACERLDGFHWTACGAGRPVNFLIGPPTQVAEMLTEVFRSGGVGAWKRAARRATAGVVRAIDADGEPRSLRLIGLGLQQVIQKDRELKVVCNGWVERFLDLADQFGDSIGPNGVDIAELLNQGMTVVLDNDAFEHPSLGGDVVALGLAEAKRCANLVPGGYRLIFEEAGQLGDRIDLAEPFHRAGRRRKISVDDLTQAESDLVFHGNDGITANIATRVYFAQELKSLQKVAADRLGIDHRQLDPANMRDFTAYIAHGKIRRLVRFPKPVERSVSATDALTKEKADTENGHRYEVIELPQRGKGENESTGSRALPPPSTTLQKILDSIYPEGGCERWGGKHDRAGHRVGKETCPADCAIPKHVNGCYGLVWVDGRWQKVHRLRWELAYGVIPIDKQGRKITVDHLRTCAKDCSKLAHLSLCTRGENSSRRWRVRGVSSAAD
jgi:hypothetical protein